MGKRIGKPGTGRCGLWPSLVLLFLALVGLFPGLVSAQTVLSTATNSLTLSLGNAFTGTYVGAGTLANNYALVGTLPPGLSFSTTTTDAVISGTPSVAGTYAFSIRVNFYSGATVGTYDSPFVVNVLTSNPTAGNVTVVVQANSSGNSIAASTGGTVTSVALASMPSHGSATVSGLGFSYTPATNYVGSDSFTYTAAGPGGISTPATVNISVVAAAPGAADAVLSVPYGAAGTIDLAPFVSGPTFTGIGIAVSSGPSHGSATVSGTQLTYTPAAGFSGTDTLTYVARAIGGTSSPAVLTINVGSRPDPRSDPSVTNMLKAGAATVRRFQSAQIQSIHSRLDAIDGTQSPLPSQTPEARRECGDISFWSSGLSGFGSVGGDQGTKFDTTSFSVGGDRCFGTDARVGLAVGYGSDRGSSRIDSSRSSGRASSVSSYGSLRLLSSVRLSWMAGVGRVELDYDRQVSALDDYAHGHWAGTQWQSSVSANYDWNYRNFRFAPFSRVDLASIQLDSYTESGGGAYALQYQGQRLETGRVTLGLNGEFRYEGEFGKAVPRLRIEYTRDFAKRQEVQVGYADSSGSPSYNLPADGEERRVFNVTFGSDFYLRNGLSWGFNLGHSRANGGNGATTAQARVSQKF